MRTKTDKVYKQLKAVKQADWKTKTTKELAIELGISYSSVYNFRKEHNKPQVAKSRTPRSNNKLRDANWKLPIQALSTIWNMVPSYLSNERKINNYPKARWDMREKKEALAKDPVLRYLIEEEIEKATNIFAESGNMTQVKRLKKMSVEDVIGV